MRAIVCVDNRWGIGKNGKLLFHLPNDMKHFREYTKDCAVIMGRKTYESIGSPLKGRTNLILTSDPGIKRSESVVPFDNLSVLFETIRWHEVLGVRSDTFVVIGGSSVYRKLLPYCDEISVTYVHEQGDADTFIDNLDESENWVCSEKSEPFMDNGHLVEFRVYKNQDPGII